MSSELISTAIETPGRLSLGDEREPTSWVIPEDLLGLDAETISDLVGSFVRDTAERLEHLRMAVHARELGGVRRQAHSVKGSSRQMGAGRMADLCLQIEQNCERYSALDLDTMLQKLASAFQSTSQAMLASTGRHGHEC